MLSPNGSCALCISTTTNDKQESISAEDLRKTYEHSQKMCFGKFERNVSWIILRISLKIIPSCSFSKKVYSHIGWIFHLIPYVFPYCLYSEWFVGFLVSVTVFIVLCRFCGMLLDWLVPCFLSKLFYWWMLFVTCWRRLVNWLAGICKRFVGWMMQEQEEDCCLEEKGIIYLSICFMPWRTCHTLYPI